MVDLATVYRSYIACLNSQDWENLDRFVHEDVQHNDNRLGLSGYSEMLEQDFELIPDLHFDVHLLIVDPPTVASRLQFNCTPKGVLFGIPVNGRRVRFAENAFYEFQEGRIAKVWSVVDKAGIQAQLYENR